MNIGILFRYIFPIASENNGYNKFTYWLPFSGETVASNRPLNPPSYNLVCNKLKLCDYCCQTRVFSSPAPAPLPHKSYANI